MSMSCIRSGEMLQGLQMMAANISDAVVMSVADDIIESFDPDPDNDGVQERGGALQTMDGKWLLLQIFRLD